MSSHEIDIPKLAALLAKKRQSRPYRVIADEIGNVSSPTLSRIEKGSLPDLDTFMRLCRWLEVSPEDFQQTSGSGGERTLTNQERICAFLRADRNLPVDTAKALTKMIELAYQDTLAGRIREE